MSREIRRVPKDWEHPKRSQFFSFSRDPDSYQPMYDADYDDVSKEWVKNFMLFVQSNEPGYYWEDNPTPNELYYRSSALNTKFDSEPDCYQIYETVSEGTPCSPKFNTLNELVEWLVQQGYSRKAAENFAKDGSCMSGIIMNGIVYRDIEALGVEFNKTKLNTKGE